jgi:hypothetical protein
MRMHVRTMMGGALGAGLMYLFDPKQGRRRRARAKDQLAARWRRTERAIDRQRRYQAGVEAGLRHRAGTPRPPADDRTLADRIRSQLGTTFPHDHVSLSVFDGVVELRGELPDREAIEDLVWRICCVAGVVAVTDLMHLPGEPAPTKEAARRASTAASGASRPNPQPPPTPTP